MVSYANTKDFKLPFMGVTSGSKVDIALQTFDGALENRAAYQLAIMGLCEY